MDIVFLGLNGIGRRVYDWLVDNGEHVRCVLTSQRQLDLLEILRPDLVVSAGFRDIVPARYLEIPSYGCINLHKSLLPYNRGAQPNVWSIVEDTPAGVSMHYMDSGIDTGPVIAQRGVQVEFSDTGETLYRRLEEVQFELFRETWPSIRAGQVEPQPQSGSGSLHYKRDFGELCRLDLDSMYRVGELINVLRATTFPPYRNAYVVKNGRRYYIEIAIRPEDQPAHRESRWR